MFGNALLEAGGVDRPRASCGWRSSVPSMAVEGGLQLVVLRGRPAWQGRGRPLARKGAGGEAGKRFVNLPIKNCV